MDCALKPTQESSKSRPKSCQRARTLKKQTVEVDPDNAARFIDTLYKTGKSASFHNQRLLVSSKTNLALTAQDIYSQMDRKKTYPISIMTGLQLGEKCQDDGVSFSEYSRPSVGVI